MGSYYKQQLLDFVANLDVTADSVYDCGGSQDPIKGRTKTWDVRDYKIVDLPQPHGGNKPDIEFDLNKDTWDGEPAELAFCLEVLDYIYDPMKAFKSLRAMGETVWISCGLTYPVHNPVEDDSLRLTEYGIRNLAKASGFEVAEIIYRRPRGNRLLEFYAEDGMRAAPDQDHRVIGYIACLK